MLASDLAGLEGGERGDVLVEWIAFDTDRDGVDETKWPRLRFVRQASAAEVSRLPGEREIEGSAAAFRRAESGLTEVLWLVVPASSTDPEARAEGVLWRGERLLSDPTRKSLLAPDTFGASNLPPAGSIEEVGGGVLWLGVLLATQTSIVHDGWRLGSELDCAATSWDAWSRGRPDPDVHPWNEPGTGMPTVRDRPLLPRRVRFEIEIERGIDRKRRTTLAAPVEIGDGAITVDDPDRIPREAESFVLVDAEWMRVLSIAGPSVAVRRGERGTKPAGHAPGARVHYGLRLVREVPVATYREDWNL